jgi:hypothetical protein
MPCANTLHYSRALADAITEMVRYTAWRSAAHHYVLRSIIFRDPCCVQVGLFFPSQSRIGCLGLYHLHFSFCVAEPPGLELSTET